jgi:hypothetical protein
MGVIVLLAHFDLKNSAGILRSRLMVGRLDHEMLDLESRIISKFQSL